MQVILEGKILKSGTPEDLAADETVRRVYLGKNFELKRKNKPDFHELRKRKTVW